MACLNKPNLKPNLSNDVKVHDNLPRRGALVLQIPDGVVGKHRAFRRKKQLQLRRVPTTLVKRPETRLPNRVKVVVQRRFYGVVVHWNLGVGVPGFDGEGEVGGEVVVGEVVVVDAGALHGVVDLFGADCQPHDEDDRAGDDDHGGEARRQASH